jgi:hypothetical protein
MSTMWQRMMGVIVIGLIGLIALQGCNTLAGAVTGVKNPNTVDDGKNKLPIADAVSLADTASSADAANLADGASAVDACACLQKGMAFRFSSLQIKTLDGGPHLVIKTLNPLWQNDINNKELNFYIEIMDVADTEFTMRIVNGARTDAAGNVCTLPVTESTVVMHRDGCKMWNTVPTGLNVYAGTTANPKNCTTDLAVPNSIPVRNANFEAQIVPQCTGITQGVLVEGSIGKAALDGTCSCLTLGSSKAEDCGTLDPSYPGYPSTKNKDGQPPEFCTECCKGCVKNKYTNLKELLVSFGKLNYKCKDENGLPAVCLSAAFEAPRVETIPVPCP